MLRHTFCHIPQVDSEAEQGLWDAGIVTWKDALVHHTTTLPSNERRSFESHLKKSDEHIENSDARYFADLLPPKELWRIFPIFRNATAFLDIETTGLSYSYDHVTTIVLYDGQSIRHYVRGKNLADFRRDILKYQVLVTYNGKCFDLPFLRNTLVVDIRLPHIDLRYILKDLGYAGGLKKCERRLGIHRRGMEEIDGEFAPLLWRYYRRHSDERALDTLLAYNTTDVLSLEKLLVIAYNLKLRKTPFARGNSVPKPRQPKNPFKVHALTVRRILHQSNE